MIDVFFPWTYEFIAEEEFMGYSTDEIEKVRSLDGHSFTVYAVKDKDMSQNIIVAYDDEQEWDIRVWRLIQLGPSDQLGYHQQAVNGQIRPLIVVTGENEKNNLMAINEGYILIEIGFDADPINRIKAAIEEVNHYEFFNALAMQIVNFIINPELYEDGDEI